jgi:hypothetical protein
VSDEAPFRRVLVALDASRESRHALETSAEIAGRLRAELVGLFVEDLNLLRMAALPASRVLAPGSGACELDVPTIERALRVAADELREVVDAIARRSARPCEFLIARGLVASEVASRSAAGDLVVVAGRTAAAAWQAMVADAGVPILAIGPSAADRERMIAVYPDEAAWESVVSAIGDLAAALGRGLVVVRPQDAEPSQFDRRLNALLEARVPWRALAAPPDVDVLAAAARFGRDSVVALPGSRVDVASADALAGLLRRAGCSMLLVR